MAAQREQHAFTARSAHYHLDFIDHHRSEIDRGSHNSFAFLDAYSCREQ
jgi:hypothetical protein